MSPSTVFTLFDDDSCPTLDSTQHILERLESAQHQRLQDSPGMI